MSWFPGRTYWLALLLMLVMCIFYVQQRELQARHRDYLHRANQTDAMRDRLEAAQDTAAALERRVDGLATDQVEMERALRERNWVRQGETVYRIELPGSAGSAAADGPDEAEPIP